MSLLCVNSVDICLFLEGIFFYVSGGVFSWVNQIICGFFEYIFVCCFVGSWLEDYGEMKYDLLDNVVYFEVYYLYDQGNRVEKKGFYGNQQMFENVDCFYCMVCSGCVSEECNWLFMEFIGELGDGGVLFEEVFLYSCLSWDLILESYCCYSCDFLFVDYFWMVWIMYVLIWILNWIVDNLIFVKMYYIIFIGYVGFFGVFLCCKIGCLLLFLEYGIYIKEWKIDFFQSEWISDNWGLVECNNVEMVYFCEKWINFF